MHKAFLSLGTNMGKREKNLSKAIRYINVGIGHIIDLSGIYETEPWGFESEDKFLNMVVEIITELTPLEMIDKCLEIETRLGRERDDTEGYTSRPIDVDILFYNEEIISESNLIVPHPHLHNRKFILEPLSEIAPDYMHPILGMSINELKDVCPDKSSVIQLGSISYD